MKRLFASAFVLLALLIAVPAGPAWADEPPPPPDWSAPTGTPAPETLPPPRVVDAPVPGSAAVPPPPQPPAAVPSPIPEPPPAAPDPEDEFPVRNAPERETPERDIPYGEGPGEYEVLDHGRGGYRPPGTERGDDAPPPPTVAELIARYRSESAVISIRKSHNQPWFGMWRALELDILLHVYGQAGRDIGASVTFYRERDGSPLRARMQPYVDAQGTVSVYTKIIRIAEGSKLLHTKLKIPYRAFPYPSTGADYAVEARVRLLRREANGVVTALARGSTVFAIHIDRDCMVCVPACEADARPIPERGRRLRHDLQGLFGEESQYMKSGQQEPPSVDPLTKSRWYEWKWRTRGLRDHSGEAAARQQVPQVCRGVGCPPERCSPRSSPERPCTPTR